MNSISQDSGKHNKYKFSFTAASLQVPIMIRLSQKLVSEKITMDQLQPEDIGKERAKTNQREFIEMKARLNTLSEDEIVHLSNGPYEEQRLLSLIAFARTYQFFYDFMIQVVTEKVAIFDFTLTDMDYNVFFNKISVDHPEAERLTTATQYKLKQVVFKVLEQSGIINNVKERIIRSPHLSVSFTSLISTTRPQDLRLLLN